MESGVVHLAAKGKIFRINNHLPAKRILACFFIWNRNGFSKVIGFYFRTGCYRSTSSFHAVTLISQKQAFTMWNRQQANRILLLSGHPAIFTKKNVKQGVVILFLLFSLSACSKQDTYIGTPSKEMQADEGLTITNFSGRRTDEGIHLRFRTAGDLSQISSLKIFSGSSSNELCIIGTVNVKNDEPSAYFSFDDTYPKGPPTYYMIGVEDLSGTVTYVNKIWTIYDPK